MFHTSYAGLFLIPVLISHSPPSRPFVPLLQEPGPERVLQRLPAETQRVSALPAGPGFGRLSAGYAKNARSTVDLHRVALLQTPLRCLVEKAEEDEVLFSPVRGGLRYSDPTVFESDL